MVNVVDMENKNFRTFGWVQDPSDFDALYRVVCIFNRNSKIHRELVEKRIKKLIEKRDGRERLLSVLNSEPLRITYSDLVGTSFTPRTSARCNGIVQATIKGQRREYISDWPADNFVRWAQALGFIKYNYYYDSFEITEIGIEFSNSKDEQERDEHIELALLSYPPAVRILKLLETGQIMTKFELGKQLGFIGEDGFTSLPQDIFIMTLNGLDNTKERNKLKTDVEGSSDKYARMIAKWLEKLELLKQVTKSVKVKIGNNEYEENIGQSYIITAKGLKSLNRIKGKSKYKMISKNVSWEMFATKGKDRDYIRTRRAYILKILIESNKPLTLNEIEERLQFNAISEYYTAIEDDILGFINIGINIETRNGMYKLNDSINDFIIPRIKSVTKSEITERKDRVREKLDSLPHEYLSLIDLAFDSNQNRLFEMKVMELLLNECKYKGLHLGGSRKPDGIIYTNNLNKNYGVIIDTKAYSRGYSLPISQADEMSRYILENTRRDVKENANTWWNNFDSEIKEYYFAFISGEFVGNIKEKLERIALTTKINGVAVTIFTLLLFANNVKSKRLTLDKIRNIFVNEEYRI
ncbi:MAG: restriction endonuclease FokI C-terminal domain-containing protein [Eubacteriales bacterium]|nr:restriction endonuclease FokI C-terminal domain-containing protein [Eubacteriales bacterium]